MHLESNVKRILDLDLPAGQSAFLYGPRQTGKSTLLRSKFQNSKTYNLLKRDIYTRLATAPHLIREELRALKKRLSY